GSKPGALGLLATPLQYQDEICAVPPACRCCHAPSAPSNGDCAAPCAIQALGLAGNRASAASADARSGNSTKQPLPVPVSRGDPTCANAANAASTAGSRRRSTDSNALPGKAPETKSDIVAGAAFRVNSGAANSSAVATWTSGSTSTYQ